MDAASVAPSWPPGHEDAALLATLADIIARGGPARFLDARLVAADRRDFPESWQPTRAAVERLLARLCWHAHVDLDVVVEDARPQAHDRPGKLRQSVIEWLGNEDGAAIFQLEQIGNDDVAGLLAHEIGRAFLSWIPSADPYRDVAQSPDAIAGSVAAIYLGLGVLAVNSAVVQRATSEIQGYSVAWERDVVVRGGLTTRGATYLLAVQAVARDHEADAFATLEPRPRAALRQMIAALRPHRAALLERLGVDPEAPRPELERDDTPPAVTDEERPEPDLGLVKVGAPVFRVPHRRTTTYGTAGGAGGGALMVVLGIAGVAMGPALIAALIGGGVVAGAIVGHRVRYHECATCERLAPPEATTCAGCGGTFRGEIAHRNLRLEKEEELEDDL